MPAGTAARARGADLDDDELEHVWARLVIGGFVRGYGGTSAAAAAQTAMREMGELSGSKSNAPLERSTKC